MHSCRDSNDRPEMEIGFRDNSGIVKAEVRKGIWREMLIPWANIEKRYQGVCYMLYVKLEKGER